MRMLHEELHKVYVVDAQSLPDVLGELILVLGEWDDNENDENVESVHIERYFDESGQMLWTAQVVTCGALQKDSLGVLTD